MLEKHPNRKKDKYNPYTLTITEGHYYLSFKDGRGKQQNIEIDEMLYQTFDGFEFEGISHLNRVSRHIEHSELTYEQIAKLESCTKRAVKFSVDIAVEKLKKNFKIF